MLPTLGIDISKDCFHVELSINHKLRHRRFANRKAGFTELSVWLAKQKAAGPVHACLEATGIYSEPVALYLHQQGHTVSIVNPAQIKAFGQSELLRNKDDRPDAGLIRRFCEKQQPPAWTPAAPHLRELQALTRHLENLLETRQQQINRLEVTTTKAIVKSLRKLVTHLDTEIRRTEQQINDLIDRHRISNSNANCWIQFLASAHAPPPGCWLKLQISATTNQPGKDPLLNRRVIDPRHPRRLNRC